MEELTLRLFLKKYKFLLLFLSFLIPSLSLFGLSELISSSKVSTNIDYYSVKKGQSFYTLLEDFSLSHFEKFLLKIYLKRNKLDIAQSGYYYLSGQSWKDFFNSISIGNVVIFKLEIPSGKNLYEIEKIILSSNLTHDCTGFKCLNTKYDFIEGTIKPDTYFYKYSMLSSKILKKSQTDFFEIATKMWSKRHPETPLNNLADAIILASIVEKEAGNKNEMSVIAGVFLHRLSIDMKLQADPTIIYGLLPNFNGDITKANIKDKNNVYNTYQIKGLPPTPISTISKTSLEAVILGEKNDYLYFVAKGDGTHYFSKTYEEHLRAVKKYQLN